MAAPKGECKSRTTKKTDNLLNKNNFSAQARALGTMIANSGAAFLHNAHFFPKPNQTHT
jgi:hypothetical protein